MRALRPFHKSFEGLEALSCAWVCWPPLGAFIKPPALRVVHDWTVPLADLDLGEAEIAAVTQVLRTQWLSMGPVTTEFERRFAAMIGLKPAFAVTNRTAALHLAYVALGAGPGDTVLLSLTNLCGHGECHSLHGGHAGVRGHHQRYRPEFGPNPTLKP